MLWGAVAGAAVSVIGNKILNDDSGGSQQQIATEADAASAEATRKQTEIAEKTFAHYEKTFKPLEEQLGTEALTYGTPEEQERAAAEAHGDVTQAYGRARDAQRRSMASYGINPASGRFADVDLKMNLDEARAGAGAQNLARRGVRDLAFAKKMDVAGLGRGLPSTSASAFGAAASTNAARSGTNFLQGQFLQDQARAGMAPFISIAQQGVRKWFDAPPATTGNFGFGPSDFQADFSSPDWNM